MSFERTPQSRLEKFLAKIAGLDIDILPKNTKEYWLEQIAAAAKEHLTGEDPRVDQQFESSIQIYNTPRNTPPTPTSDEIIIEIGTYQEHESVLSMEGEQSSQVRVTGVKDPQGQYDAANKRYVDGTLVEDQDSVSITLAMPADNTIYSYAELESLTITDIPATGSFVLRFFSGSTATDAHFPPAMKFPKNYSNFECEANTRYEISVTDGYALVAEWDYTL